MEFEKVYTTSDSSTHFPSIENAGTQISFFALFNFSPNPY